MTKFIITIWMARNLCTNIGSRLERMQEFCVKYFKKHMFWIFVRIASLRRFQQISKNMFLKFVFYKNKASSFLYIILLIKASLQQQINFNSILFGNNAVVVTRVHPLEHIMDSSKLIEDTVFTLSIRTRRLLTILVLKFEQVQFTTRCCVSKIAGWVANSVDPDETPHSAASHLGQYCLLRPVRILSVNMVFTLGING